MKRRAVYPGTFDPVTRGHVNIIELASRMVDELIVGVLNNSNKTPLFTPEERVDMIKESVAHLPNVKVVAFDGLLVEFAKKYKALFVIRGLRAVTDFEYEFQMSHANRIIDPDVDTVFLTTATEYSYISSTTVREIASFGGDIRKFVTKSVEKKVREKMKNQKK